MLALGKDAMRLALPACGRGHASGHAGSTTLCAGVRPRGPQRASMARRSTGACPGCSWHSVEPRESVWEGQEGQSRPFRERWCAEGRHDYEFPTRGAGGGLARRAARWQAGLQPFNSVFYIATLAATACGGRRGRSCFASTAYYYDTRVGSPPASPAVGPGGATLVGSVLSRLCSAAWLTQSAADAAWGCRRGCCSARCAEGVAILSSPSRRRHLLLAAALPFPSIAQTHTHTHARTHTLLMIEYYLLFTDDWAAARRGGGRGEAAARRGG